MADYANLGSRIVAIIIDLIILSLVVVIIALPLGLLAGLSAIGNPTQLFAARIAFFVSFMVLNVLVWLLYFTYFEGTSGQTLGKKIMGHKGSQRKWRPAIVHGRSNKNDTKDH